MLPRGRGGHQSWAPGISESRGCGRGMGRGMGGGRGWCWKGLDVYPFCIFFVSPLVMIVYVNDFFCCISFSLYYIHISIRICI